MAIASRSTRPGIAVRPPALRFRSPAERAGLTGSAAQNTLTGEIAYSDLNQGDVPTAQASFASFKYENAQHSDVTTSLTAEQIAAIKAVEVPLVVVQDPNQKNKGTATWTYSVPDGAFDFLAAGETLTLTYIARVDNNYAQNNEITFKTFTITISGTNDAPTVTTSGGTVIERDGTGNTTIDTISGTVTFTDADLTDRPVVSAAISTTEPFRYLDAQGHNVTATLTPAQLAAIEAVKIPLTVAQGSGSGHNGSATWTYSIADHAFDFLAKGERLILNYVIKVDDGHGGVVYTPVSISINGADVTVIGTNDAPTVTSDEQIGTIAERVGTVDSTALNEDHGTIQFTDVDLTDMHDVDVTDVVASGLTTGLAGHTAQMDWLSLGTFSDTTGGVPGSQHWTFSASDHFFDYLADGESVTLTYSVEIDDLHGGLATEHVAVTVTGSNDAPVVSADVSGPAGTPTLHAIGERPDVTGSTDPDIATGSLAFQDADLSDTHLATSSGPVFGWLNPAGDTLTSTQKGLLAQASGLTLILHDSTGTGLGSVGFTYSAADGTFDFLAAGEKLTITYDITVTDEHDVASTQPITITVTGTNDIATIDGESTGSLVEDATATINSGEVVPLDTVSGVLTVHDVDHGEGHFRAVAPSALTGTYGTFTFDSGTGAWTYQVDSSKVQSLGAGVDATDTLTVTSADGTDHEDIVVTITGTNDVATIDGDSTGSLLEDATTQVNSGEVVPLDTVSGVLTAHDIDTGENHFEAVDPESLEGEYGQFTFSSDTGQWTYQVDSSKVQSLGDGVHDTDTLTVTSADGTADQDIVVTITGTNDIATIDGDSTGSLLEDATAPVNSGQVVPLDTVSGVLTVHDVDSGEAHFAAVLPSALIGTYGTFTFDSGTGAWTYKVDSSKVQSLGEGDHVADTLTVTSADGTASEHIVVTINGTNDAPDYSGNSLASTYHAGNAPVAIVDGVSAADIDSDNYDGGTLTAEVIDGSHDGDTLSIASDHISIVASGNIVMYDADGIGGADAIAIGTLTNYDYNSLLVTLNADAGDEAVVALTEAIKFSNSTGTPAAGTRTVAFTLHDGGGTASGGHDSDYFEAHVTVPGAAPVIQTDLFTLSELGDGITTVAGLYVTDADAAGTETFTFSATTGASPASSVAPSIGPGHREDINDALELGVTYNPGNNPQPLTDTVTFTVTDGAGHSDTVNFIFNVTGGEGDVELTGTNGKDVIIATGNTDTLTGGAGADQFVFRIGDGNDTITDFAQGQDHIDLRAFFETVNTDNIADWLASNDVTTNAGDTLLQLGDDSILLKGVDHQVTNLTANDFILHPGGGVGI